MATFTNVTGSASAGNQSQFKITFSGESEVRLFGAYASESHQYNLVTATPDNQCLVPAEWAQRLRSAFLRQTPAFKPQTVAARKKPGFYKRFLIRSGDVKGTDIAVRAGPPENPDLVYVVLTRTDAASATAAVTITVRGGDVSAENKAYTPKPRKKPYIARVWRDDLYWKDLTGRTDGKSTAPRTPVPVAGNTLTLLNAEEIELGPQPAPSKKAKDYNRIRASKQRYNDAFGKLVVRNTSGAPLTTTLLYGTLCIWRPAEDNPLKTVSEIILEGGVDGVTLDRRIQLASTEVMLPVPSKKGSRAGFAYRARMDYTSEGILPDEIGSVFNGPTQNYESLYVYTPDGDQPREPGRLKLQGAHARDTMQVSARGIKNTPVDISNATLEVWLDTPADDDKLTDAQKTRLPVRGAELGSMDVGAGGVLRLKMPRSGLLNYAEWVRKFAGDKLVNWRWVRDLYQEGGARVLPAPQKTTEYVNQPVSKANQPAPAAWDDRYVSRYDAFKTADDTWEGNQITGAGLLEIDADDATYLAVTGRDVTVVPVKYFLTKAPDMPTAVFLSQQGVRVGHNYSHIKGFTGTLSVRKGYAMCVPTVVIPANDTTPEAVAGIQKQREFADLKITQLSIAQDAGARATFSVCGNVTLPAITGTGVGGSRVSRVVFQSAYVTETGAELPDAQKAVYTTVLRPGGSMATYSEEVIIGKNITLELADPSTADLLAAPASSPRAALRLDGPNTVRLVSTGTYRLTRPLRPTSVCDVVANTDCYLKTDILGTGSVTLRPEGNVLRFSGAVTAGVRIDRGVVTLAPTSVLRGPVGFVPKGVTERQDDRVLRTRTNTYARGRQTYEGKLILGPDGVLQIGSL